MQYSVRTYVVMYNVADSDHLHPRGFYTLKSAPILHHIINSETRILRYKSGRVHLGCLKRSCCWHIHTHAHTTDHCESKHRFFSQFEIYFLVLHFMILPETLFPVTTLRTENSITSYSVLAVIRSYYPLATVLGETSLLFQPIFHYIITIPVWAVRTTASN